MPAEFLYNLTKNLSAHLQHKLCAVLPKRRSYLLKGSFIMKKSTKVLFNAYKVIFALTAIALIITYVRGLISPTAVNAVISGNDWFTLGYMSVVYALIAEKEKNARLQSAEKN